MTFERTTEYLRSLLSELIKLPNETEWVEFKHNRAIPGEIGEYISALSNSAALYEKASAYVIWGVDDKTHEIIGTTFKPNSEKKGNEELESWLLRMLNPKIHFKFFDFEYNNKNVVILEIASAFRHPVQFQHNEYIRIKSNKKKLKDFPEKERELWRIFDKTPFELLLAKKEFTDDEVIALIDYPSYFDLLNLPLPSNKNGILETFESEDMIVKTDTNKWNITNLGAILFAKKISNFPLLKRKAFRVILYKDNSRIETIKELIGKKGYATGFEDLIEYITSLLPSNEIIEKALRKKTLMYPEIAIRELVANMVIHQDFFLTGQGVMIEIFSDRIEITNPGKPLVNVNRFLDTPPKSRNERLASFMRRIGVCEERGSGIDKVVHQTELYQLPAPLFEVVEGSTRAILFAHKPLNKMDKSDRIRACYLHTCLKYVNRENTTNASLRERFGIEKQNSAVISRIIRDTIESKLIKDANPSIKSRKYATYIPFWV